MTQPDPTPPALYDAARGGAIWDHLMTRTDGEHVARWMVQALREQATRTLPEGMIWQDRALDLAFPDDAAGFRDAVDQPTPGDVMWWAVASNVLIELRDDFRAQVREAEARGAFIAPALVPA